MSELCFATAVHLLEGALHRAGEVIGVENRSAAEVARRASHGLDQRPVRSQEAFLIGIEHRDERDLRQVQALPQQVDPHQDIELAESEPPNDLDALDRIDFRV